MVFPTGIGKVVTSVVVVTVVLYDVTVMTVVSVDVVVSTALVLSFAVLVIAVYNASQFSGFLYPIAYLT
jgi:hypothetical protein